MYNETRTTKINGKQYARPFILKNAVHIITRTPLTIEVLKFVKSLHDSYTPYFITTIQWKPIVIQGLFLSFPSTPLLPQETRFH